MTDRKLGLFLRGAAILAWVLALSVMAITSCQRQEEREPLDIDRGYWEPAPPRRAEPEEGCQRCSPNGPSTEIETPTGAYYFGG